MSAAPPRGLGKSHPERVGTSTARLLEQKRCCETTASGTGKVWLGSAEQVTVAEPHPGLPGTCAQPEMLKYLSLLKALLWKEGGAGNTKVPPSGSSTSRANPALNNGNKGSSLCFSPELFVSFSSSLNSSPHQCQLLMNSGGSFPSLLCCFT